MGTTTTTMLTSVGSILPELDGEEDLEMDNLSFMGGLGLGLGFGRKESMRTVRGDPDVESGEVDVESGVVNGVGGVMSPAPAYNLLEMGFGHGQVLTQVSGIRVNVEKTTSSI